MDHARFQARFKELENRIKKWRVMKLGFIENRMRVRERDRSSTSAEYRHARSVTSSPAHRPSYIGCLTSPMERKKILTLPMQASPSRRDVENEQIDEELDRFAAKSGFITTDGNCERIELEDVDIIEVLGKGSCGIVELARIGKKEVAVKTMRKNENKEEKRRILRDLQIMTSSSHPNIVSSFGFFMSTTSVKMCMELMTTCCEKLLRRLYHSEKQEFFPEVVLGRIAVSVISALDYLNDEHSVIHRDIKPSNILFDWDGNVKICDFGISGYLSQSMVLSKNEGCPPYMSPERLHSETSSSYDCRSDVWSLGVTLFQLASGRYPFPLDKIEFQTLSIIADKSICSPSLAEEGNFSPSCSHFVDLCMQKEVLKRPKYKQLMIQHFYLAHGDCSSNNVTGTDGNQQKTVAEWLKTVISMTNPAHEHLKIPNAPNYA